MEQVFVAPGNDGMTLDGLNTGIPLFPNILRIEFAKENDIAWSFYITRVDCSAGLLCCYDDCIHASGWSRISDLAKSIVCGCFALALLKAVLGLLLKFSTFPFG